MNLFGDIDLTKLFDPDSEYGKSYVFGELTDEMIARGEQTLGYKMPASYIELLKVQNGGMISDEFDESWLTTIYGIGPTADTYNSLEERFENWKDEWEYPDIGIPFGETQSAGHDMYYMDFRSADENGEPRIVRIDNEMDNEVYFVADNLVEFIKLIIANQEIEEKCLD